MGQAKDRLSRAAKMIRQQPWCVYCGGAVRGESIDHMPPITMFDRRQRPKDLEFVACESCNQGARQDDQVVGLISRMYPEPGSTVLDSDLEAAFSSIVNNHPALLRELQARPRQMTRLRKMGYEGHALNAGGPLLNRSICRFGARMGLALHFRFAGRIVPAGGSIAVKWMTNVQLFEHGIPREIIELIGPPRTLRQGSFDVGNQFMYSGVTAVDTGTMSAHVATFRQSFGIIAFVAETVSQMGNWRSENVYEPGFLKRP